MRAIDTNIVVRCLVDADTAERCAEARAFVQSAEVFVPTTVLLESEWVLREAYAFSKPDVLAAIRAFLCLPNVVAEEIDKAMTALDWADAGFDFADALHLAAARDCDDFTTFDRTLARTRRQDGAVPVNLLATNPG